MIDLDIIEPIEKPTDWINSLVIVEKSNGRLRICLDPWPINNVRNIFINVLHLLAFNTPLGRSCFNILLYGIYSASEKDVQMFPVVLPP